MLNPFEFESLCLFVSEALFEFPNIPSICPIFILLPIKIIGLRPGEKLYEELMMDEEQDKMRRTVHNKIFVAPPRNIDLGEFYQQLQELAVAAEHNDDSVVEQLAKMVPTFTPTRENLKL